MEDNKDKKTQKDGSNPWNGVETLCSSKEKGSTQIPQEAKEINSQQEKKSSFLGDRGFVFFD